MKVLYLCVLLILSIWVLIMVAFFSCSTAMQQPPVQQTPVEKDLVYVCGLSMALEKDEKLIKRIHSIVKPDKIFVVTKKVSRNLPIPVIQIKEPQNLPKIRIDRIASLRNYCLKKIQNYNLYMKNKNDWKNIKLIWVDLDMLIPDKTLRVVRSELTHNSTYDVICANGRANFDDKIYYDVSATILNDGTFAYLTQWVVHPKLNKHVTFTLINGVFPLENNEKKYTPVKSCFGGLTIYKFPIQNCRYELSKNLVDKFYDRYKYNDYGKVRICEHIPFNRCLQKRGARLAVNLDMKVFWSGR